MTERIRTSTDEKEKGFTLIELLVVVVIIGVLAAIAIPVYLNQQKKAHNAAAESDAKVLATEVATWYVDSTTAPVLNQAGGRWTIGATGASAVSTSAVSDGVILVRPVATNANAQNWSFCVRNTKGSGSYLASAAAGVQQKSTNNCS